MLSRISYYLSSVSTILTGVENWSQIIGTVLGNRSSVIKLKDGSQFKVRTPMDVWIIKETCLDKDYERASVSIQDGWTVIYIGAGLGDFTVNVARLHPRSTVYAYEPFPESFALLTENLRLNGVTNVNAYPYAISDRDGAIALDVTSSVEAVQRSTATSSDGLRVKSLALDSIFEQSGLQRCDFIKADCEGAEFDIFLSASPDTLAKIKHICLEYHDGVTAHWHPELAQHFQARGFAVQTLPNPVHKHLGFMYARNGHI
jgi:FkbM family methyltransferase